MFTFTGSSSLYYFIITLLDIQIFHQNFTTPCDERFYTLILNIQITKCDPWVECREIKT